MASFVYAIRYILPSLYWCCYSQRIYLLPRARARYRSTALRGINKIRSSLWETKSIVTGRTIGESETDSPTMCPRSQQTYRCANVQYARLKLAHNKKIVIKYCFPINRGDIAKVISQTGISPPETSSEVSIDPLGLRPNDIRPSTVDAARGLSKLINPQKTYNENNHNNRLLICAKWFVARDESRRFIAVFSRQDSLNTLYVIKLLGVSRQLSYWFMFFPGGTRRAASAATCCRICSWHVSFRVCFYYLYIYLFHKTRYRLSRLFSLGCWWIYV